MNSEDTAGTESVHEDLDVGEGDDSEKTNVTVIDSCSAPLPLSVNEPQLMCAGDSLQAWDASCLFSDLASLHSAVTQRVRRQLDSLRASHAATTARQLQRAGEESAEREAELRRSLSRLRTEVESQATALQHKDEVIKRLVAQLRVQKERVKLAQVFAGWRAVEELRKRQAFCAKLADRHAAVRAQRTALWGWKAALEATWKERVQKACRAKAEEVCLRLAADCEEKTRQMSREVDALRAQLSVAEERHQAELQGLRAALLRGVCALNVETMGVLRAEQSPEPEEAAGSESESEKAEEEQRLGRHVMGVMPRQRVTTGPVLRKAAAGQPPDSSANPRHRPIAGQESSTAAAAILVERHHPVNKRTHASLMANHERAERGVARMPM